ncbi:hypothetical protein CC1G_09964 [Coprinopsis cinerea okayama7|uniref:Uncharacterized protein n=1 Tax=Coprinopsis cinerea (strain Okayama-7 / 130 / ATCC MYA-4618 / FGSC 9003) TaxID=240176 RepID=A8PGS8_COPC7|nr:hypothetical protein CC1G_09964 [Coprinopsis cinerea okayama7\|eukprot:XP_001841272.2 hypothetical protein CC1G_09964 [Coprinopsis cinerea okayama7\
MSSKQALVNKPTLIESLPAELVARIISSRPFSIYELIKLMGVSRQFFYAILGDPTLWTTVNLQVGGLERCLPSYYALLDLALERSGTRTLRFGVSMTPECSPTMIRKIAARVVLSADRFSTLEIYARGIDPQKVVQTWVHELCSLALREETSPFTAVNNFFVFPILDGVSRFTALDMENYNLSRVFPRLQRLNLIQLTFHARHLINGLANSPNTLESLYVHGSAYSAPALMAGGILKHAPRLKRLGLITHTIVPDPESRFETPIITRQSSLELLGLAGPLSFLRDELQSLRLPSLHNLALFRHRGSPSGGSLVDDILRLVDESGSKLTSLTLKNFSFSNENLVRLLVALPHLVNLHLTFPAGGTDHHLFRMLFDRSQTGTVLPKLKEIVVETCPDYEGKVYEFPKDTWEEFVNDPRRQPGGNLGTLTYAHLSFGQSSRSTYLHYCLPWPLN